MSYQDFSNFLAYPFWGNVVLDWLFASVTSVLALFLIRIIIRVGVTRLTSFTKQTSTILDDAVVRELTGTHDLFILIIALFLGSLFLQLSEQIQTVVSTIASIALIIQGGLWINNVGIFWLKQESIRRRETDPATITTINAVGFVARLVLWILVAILLLDNLSVDVTALVAGLGVGGIAIALAVQNILGDLFASLSIVLDKPFAVGDFLIIDDYKGSVEHVGLKTTRIRSLSGEQLIIANADLLKSRIRNYGRMLERRIAFTLGVTYQTPRDKLKQIPDIIQQAITTQDKTRFDRAHFHSYGPSSLDFDIIYYVLTPEYDTYMDIQQAINLHIHERFEQEQIEFAYPTQTIHIQQNGPK